MSGRLPALIAVAALCATASPAQDRSAPTPPGAADRLVPTNHPPLPVRRAHYWYVDDAAISASASRRSAALMRLTQGAAMIRDGKFAEALPLVSSRDLEGSPVASYGRYYTAVAQIGLSRLEQADATLRGLSPLDLQGALKETAALLLADVAMKRGEPDRAEDLLEDLSGEELARPEDVFVALGRAEEAAGHTDHALEAYRRVYYDFPLTTQANEAAAALERLQTAPPAAPDGYRRELARAQQLFDGRRWAQARAAFEPLLKVASGDDRELIALRLAECAYYLDRFSEARKALQPYLDDSRREAEARFFHLTATRALGDTAAYLKLARGLMADHPESDWAAETLHNLASHHIVLDQDDAADGVFRELLQKFPRHRHSERAAWRTGWLAYRRDNYRETTAIFDKAAGTFPRSDYRPSWLYWAARSYDELDDRETANARYRLIVADYQNSYYGRMAVRHLESRRAPVPSASAPAGNEPPAALPTDALIRALTAAGLYDEALREVQYAQSVWGDSPALQATFAWIRNRQAPALKATERFTALRGGITAMRRAYPQFMAAGGEHLPPDVLRVIFPIDYWPLITKYADAHKLDRYLVVALMAQESTFTPEIRSSSNAIGLMQIIPPTGRTLARQLGIRGFSTAMLTRPETNVRMGTKYLKDLVDRFGGVHYALAGYNAGPHRVATWLKEAPGLPQDEFIDNIPFTETQAYVKRILGTAEDYRRLYGPGGLDPRAGLAAAAASSTDPEWSTARR